MLLLLQMEHPTKRVWEQVFCCAEASNKLTEYDLFIGGRATCGPIASKIKLPPGNVYSTRKSGRQPGSGLLTTVWNCSGFKVYGF